jgi:hypothetical protein
MRPEHKVVCVSGRQGKVLEEAHSGNLVHAVRVESDI